MNREDFGRVRMVGLLSPPLCLAHDLQILKWIIVCRCGKILPMNEKERREYVAVVREIEERRLQYAKPSDGEAAEGRE